MKKAHTGTRRRPSSLIVSSIKGVQARIQRSRRHRSVKHSSSADEDRSRNNGELIARCISCFTRVLLSQSEITTMMAATSCRLVADLSDEASTSAERPFIVFPSSSASFSPCRLAFPMLLLSSLFALNDEYLSRPSDSNERERLAEHSNPIRWIPTIQKAHDHAGQ